MSVHIQAKEGEIAERILLPGDPLRAKHIAENFLEDAKQFNEVRGMLGFTGLYNGQQVSVMGTGMGVPSISIYVNELLNEYGVKKLIRIGTCGAFQENVHIRDVILAMSASTDSNVNNIRFNGLNYAPTANFELLQNAYESARSQNKTVHVGNVFTSDTFYDNDPSFITALSAYGSLAVEMETTALYTLAAKFKAQALSILTVSDHLITKEETTSDERQTSFKDMVEIALATITK
ncbi:purine-nucleoside phosphorylase [Bacillus sp. Marseille-P3661]|uniref:purine-nucleoside phosphorylase n=1 Tax=Bacillus sp. Marseille-P3661 TaxID=1936234 RepID=UPI000C835648|nr:purine-nucleoside phosphorylase [Bacillus sp. Marseille-P3661]